jgi:hypothetical protein
MLPSTPWIALPSPLTETPSKLGPSPAHPPARALPDLKFLATVAFRVEAPLSVGETPDGVRLTFQFHGTVEGPALKGHFAPSVAYLLIDSDGVGLINARAPLRLDDGALAEIEVTGRCDFGDDGYRRAVIGDFPNVRLGWCPRFLSGHPRYLWLNRVQCLGVGDLCLKEMSIDWSLFRVTASPSP